MNVPLLGEIETLLKSRLYNTVGLLEDDHLVGGISLQKLLTVQKEQQNSDRKKKR